MENVTIISKTVTCDTTEISSFYFYFSVIEISAMMTKGKLNYSIRD